MSRSDFFLGIDLGSSSVKTSIFDRKSGKSIDSFTYPDSEMEIISEQDGWAEQDPNYWWECISHTFDHLRESNDFKSIRAIGISYQMHGLVVVDKKYNPLHNAIIWCDSRAVETGLKAEAEMNDDIFETKTLNSPGNFTASKLKWLQDNKQDIYDKIHKIMLPGDFIVYKLTNNLTTTPMGLSEGIMWDFQSGTISEDILDYYNIKDKLIPEVVDSIGDQGTVSDDIIERFGFSKGLRITYRAGDQPNNAFSLNVLEPGEIAATAGTSAVIYSVTDKNITDLNNRINTFLHCLNSKTRKRNGLLLCINGSGIAYSWIKSMLKEKSYEEMDIKSEKINSPEGIKFYPFGNGSERLFGNKKIDSHLLGFDFNKHSNNHIIRSVLEGISFSLCYSIELLRDFGVNVETVKVGKANLFLSKVFRESFINSANVKLQMFDTNGAEGAARGAALGSGYYEDATEAFGSLKIISEEIPNGQNTYLDRYKDWKNFLNKLN
ncbi:MAG: carbohydrate kinase [Flammeovirgaceae bacterium]|nr:carbohydrate kinase [Flammeovirgaceae bacterium]|tara:strand:- start:3906 stop:5381 length:1476 start_codon:yes stop_codon:yes gene_type:complete